MQGYLSSHQVEAFRQTGFVHVPSVFSPREMDEVTAWVQEMEDRADRAGDIWKYFEALEDGGRLLNRIENFEPHHAGMAQIMADDRLLGACGQLFDEEAVLFKDKINFKKPGASGFEAHQDMQAGWDRYGSLHISVLVAVDAQTEANGALEVMAGFHDKGLLGEMWAPLSDENVAGGKWETCFCQPGDALFFDSFAPHRSAPNRSDAARRAMYLTYGRLSEGDQRAQYYADKHANFPPDIERDPDADYAYKV
ncbi:phytanoyl-CoA dioxygenase PhyH [Shimia abyssi]|uniref:Phytanoyl-CoA dioxygenase PhyH n=1 Tax=Shimia abyssi TaxID=1662395 RepID=A0A2P8FKN4_9RHOB|nr:phytanoyl-CoA dioxygenase PhyH [Shimia abyssi]